MPKYEYKKENYVGLFKFDYCTGSLNTNYEEIQQIENKEKKKEFVNFLKNFISKRFYNLEKIQEYCDSIFSVDEKLLEEESENFIYFIKLIPSKGEVNCYIMIYKKVGVIYEQNK